MDQSLLFRVAGGLTASIFTGQFISPLISQPVVANWGFGPLYLGTGAALVVLSALILLGGRYGYAAAARNNAV